MIALLLNVYNLYAQRRSEIGLLIFSEIYPSPAIRPSGGLDFQYKLTPKRSLQTGLLYRAERVQGFIEVPPNGWYTFTFSRRYISTYVLYKQQVGWLALSAGPTLEYFASWKQKGYTGEARIEDYQENPRWMPGFQLIASHGYSIGEQYVIEPQLRFGNTRSISFDGNALFALGISARIR